MILCETCREDQSTICDFCIYFNHNYDLQLIKGKMTNIYVGKGFCEKHQIKKDITDNACDDFHCEFATEEGEP